MCTHAPTLSPTQALQGVSAYNYQDKLPWKLELWQQRPHS